MKCLSPVRCLRFFLILLFLSFLSGLILAEDSLKVRVRKGDTLSYLSFKTYGMFAPQVAEILKKENPQIKDIDLIYAGQQLNFPAPAEMKRRFAEKMAKPAKPKTEREIKEARPAQPPALLPPKASETKVRAQKGVLTFLEGQVEVRKFGQEKWGSACANMILTENDLIRVRSQSRAELILDNQSVLRLSENTMLILQKMEEDKASKKENTRMEMSLGRVWVKVSKIFNPASRNDIKTPTVIAGALDFAHQRKSVHRDIKPANIMRTSEGRIKVMDFGIAKPPSSPLTQDGSVLGTPAYMSPEQIQGKDLDGRSDLFSLGSILYELLTGAKPFQGENLAALTYQISHEDPPPPSQLNLLVPSAVDEVLRKVLAKNPNDRFPRGKEFARALRRALLNVRRNSPQA